LVTTFFTLDANFSVFVDSSLLSAAGDIVHMTATRAFPLREFWRIRVNFESRNGTWPLEIAK